MYIIMNYEIRYPENFIFWKIIWVPVFSALETISTIYDASTLMDIFHGALCKGMRDDCG